MEKQLELAVTGGQTCPGVRLGIRYWCTWSFEFYRCHWINLNFGFLTGLITGLSFTLVNSDEDPSRHSGQWVLISSARVVLWIPEHFKARSTSFTDTPRCTCGLFLHRSWRLIASSLPVHSPLLDKPRQSAGPRAHLDLRLLFSCHENCTRGRDGTPTQGCSSWRLKPSAAYRTAPWRTTQKHTRSLCCHKVQAECTCGRTHVELT